MKSIFNPVHLLFVENLKKDLSGILKNKKYVVLASPGFHSRNWDIYFKNPETIIDIIQPNPTIEQLSNYIEIIQNYEFDTLIAIGGGSVMDVAKSLSVLANASKKNIIKTLKNNSTKLNKLFNVIAIPTNSGTGSEVTSFATIWDDYSKKKYSLNSTKLYPSYAVIYPDLTLTQNLNQTAFSGLDALSHCFESLWNKNSNTFSESLAFHGINIILDNFTALMNNLEDIEIRKKISWASIIGGLCINQTKTAIAHSISYPLTSYLNIPHGLASGCFLNEIYKFNLENDKDNIMIKIQDTLSIKLPLEERLDELYSYLREMGLLDDIINNKAEILTLTDKMIHPDRSVNNIVNCSPTDIGNILHSFFNKNS